MAYQQQGGLGNVGIRTNIQAIARKFGVKAGEVTYAVVGQPLGGYKVIYDKSNQRAYSLPSGLTSTDLVVEISRGLMAYTTGSVDLAALATLREEWVKRTESFTSGFTLDESNEVIYSNGKFYRWGGSFPKIVTPGSTIENTGGISSTAWIDFNSLRSNLASTDLPGASLIGVSPGKTAADYFSAQGSVVKDGDNLKAILESADNGSTVTIDGDVTLNSSVVIQKAVSIKSVNSGRILWNGSSNNCIRYVLPTKKTITTPVQFLQGYNSATFPSDHGLVVGDCLEAHSTSVRHTDLSGSQYTRGQFFFVEAINGNTIVFTPSVIEGFTSTEILVTDTLRGMDFDVEIVTVKAPTGNPTGVLMDIHCARDMRGRFRIKGNEDEQYGLAVAGHNNHFDVDVWGITSGYGSVSVPGYGVNVVGTDMRITGTGGRCRHVFEIPSGNVLSANIEFDMHIVKSVNVPLFLYAAGAHANAVGWKARGSAAGSGYLIGDRTGTADISMDFFRVDDGYEYADVYFSDIHTYSAKVHGCNTFGDVARKNFVYYDCNGSVKNGTSLVIENNNFRGPLRVLQFKNNAGVVNPVYSAIIRNNTGQAVAFTNRDLAGANVTLTIEGNKLGSYGIPTTFSDYMLGVDSGGCKSYELHFHHNLIDDTLPNGVFQLQGNIDNLNLDSSYCSNGTKPLFNIAPTYLGAINGFSIDHAKTAGLMTLNVPTTTVFNAVGNVSFCDVRYDATTPIASTNVPIVFTGNSFKTSFDATLSSTKRPQGGNVNLSGKALNWNGTNIAI